MGEKKTSDVGLVLFHLYRGTGVPWLDVQLKVTFPFSAGFPDREHRGGAGGTEGRTILLRHAGAYRTREDERVTLHVEPEVSGEVNVVRDDDLTGVVARVRFPGVVDVQGDVRGRHGAGKAHAAFKLRAAHTREALGVGDDLKGHEKQAEFVPTFIYQH